MLTGRARRSAIGTAVSRHRSRGAREDRHRIALGEEPRERLSLRPAVGAEMHPRHAACEPAVDEIMDAMADEVEARHGYPPGQSDQYGIRSSNID